METQLELYRTTLEYLVVQAMRYRFIVAPNPTVGACLLYNDTIVAEGYHSHFGGKHAEIVCLENAREKGVPIEQCTLVVTLEPCIHYGKTPPCVEAILASGIRRIIIGVTDPHLTASGGISFLQEHNVEVILLESARTQYCIQDFTMWNHYQLPHIIVKLATTMDGYIATREYHSQWITHHTTREYMHSVRALLGKAHGAIMVGAHTLRCDNPKLYAVHDTAISHPRPIIVSKTLGGLDTSFLVTHRGTECIVITCQEAVKNPLFKKIQNMGVSFVIAGEESIDLKEALHILYSQYQIWYVLCEGGSMLAHSLVSLPIPIELWHCVAHLLFADSHAIPMLSGGSPRTVDEAYSFQLQTVQTLHNDIIAIYTK